MRNSDIETLGRVLDALKKYLPAKEKKILMEYSEVYTNLKTKNDKEKQAYRDKAEYYRDYSHGWKQKNPEKQRQYNEDYIERKKRKKRKKRQER